MPNNRRRRALAAKNVTEEVSNLRPPPAGLMENEYQLCKKFMDGGNCQLGRMCIYAHSLAELQAWKIQFLEKTTIDTKKNKSEAVKLLDQIKSNKNIKASLLPEINNTVCTAEPQLHIYIEKTPYEVEWKFLLHSYCPLVNVFLLHEESKDSFSITEVSHLQGDSHYLKPDDIQQFSKNEDDEWLLSKWDENCLSDTYQYGVSVTFKTAVFGSFRQSIIFNFGSMPMLQKELLLEVKPESDNDIDADAVGCKLIPSDEIWSPKNSTIIPFNDSVDENEELLKKYPLVSETSEAPDRGVSTLHGYQNKMHYYLSLEEYARFQSMSRFNLNISLESMKSYVRAESLSTMAKYAQNGTRFGRINFPSTISEDTEYGKTIMSCSSLLISIPHSKGPRDKKPKQKRIAYLSTIENFSKNDIYVNLSKRMLKELDIKEDATISVDIQFILNRLSYCEMHQCLDRIVCFGNLFPKLSLPPKIDWDTHKQFALLKEFNLNVKQKEAVIAMVAPLKDPLPPVVIIGPYGTGKTFTLANAIPLILEDFKNNILICTHSNSAADIYIKEYLNEMRNVNSAIKPLRIYYTKRWRKSVHSDVLKYCLYDEACNGFLKPTMENITDNNIIITTINTSYCLADIGIQPGFFTHIIIDEAAQIMECAALIPLSLANEKTRVILAGDYMQLGEEIFSEECKAEGFSVSLLERLFKYYPDKHPCKILLRENYRSQEEIVKLTSDLFYDGKICAKSPRMEHLYYKPLCFFAASGDDVQDTDSTSFCNHAEILELTNRITMFKEGWPLSWGAIDSTAFGVITPYLDQVTKTRKHLKNHKHGQVSVERIYNVQGKEFKVTILSTVRTRKTCTQSDDESDYGFMSNPKLITTAITRAKYMVAIIGDPVALCTIGKCRNIWKEIVERCSQSESLYGITLKELQTALRANELQRMHGLNPLAKEFVPRYAAVETADAQEFPQVAMQQVQPIRHGPMPTYTGTVAVSRANAAPARQSGGAVEFTSQAPPTRQPTPMEYIAQQLSPLRQTTVRLPPSQQLQPGAPGQQPAMPAMNFMNQLATARPANSDYGGPLRSNSSMPYLSQQTSVAQQQATPMEYLSRQLGPRSRSFIRAGEKSGAYLTEDPAAESRNTIVDAVSKHRTAEPQVPAMWDADPFSSSIWSVSKEPSKPTTSDLSRSLSSIPQVQSNLLESLRQTGRSVLGAKMSHEPSVGSLGVQNSLANPPASAQLQSQPSFQMTAQSLGISNMLMPGISSSIVMSPGQQSLQNVSYNLPVASTHILTSPSYQGAPAILSPTLTNTDLMRINRQEAHLLAPPAIMGTSSLTTPTSPYGPLASSQLLAGSNQSVSSRISQGDVVLSPLRMSTNPNMQSRLYPSRQTARDLFPADSVTGSMHSSQAAVQSPQRIGEYLPQTLTSPTPNRSSSFAMSNSPRSSTRSRRTEPPSLESLYQCGPILNYGATTANQPLSTPLNSEILASHGIPVPSNHGMSTQANASMLQMGQSSVTAFQNLQLGEGIGVGAGYQNPPTNTMPSYANTIISPQNLRQRLGSNVDSNVNVSYLEDMLK